MYCIRRGVAGPGSGVLLVTAAVAAPAAAHECPMVMDDSGGYGPILGPGAQGGGDVSTLENGVSGGGPGNERVGTMFDGLSYIRSGRDSMGHMHGGHFRAARGADRVAYQVDGDIRGR